MNLLLKFHLRFDLLQEGSLSPWPLFGRWLPNGPEDALILFDSSENVELSVWFERFGFCDNGFIKFDLSRKEVDESVLCRQTPLSAGPLHGLLKWGNVAESQREALKANPGSSKYVGLGKEVVNFLQPKLARFVEVLRTVYGQYWIPSFPKWDSRQLSLGAYCSDFLEMKWSLDDGQTWANFVPDTTSVTLVLNGHPLKEKDFLVEDDWKNLPSLVQSTDLVSTASQVLGRAHCLYDEGQSEHALVEGVTALEIAIGEFLRASLNNNATHFKDELKRFQRISLSAQLVVIAGALGIPGLDLTEAVKAVDLRNDIVHKGHSLQAKTNVRKLIRGLAMVVAQLSQPNMLKTPRATPGYALSAKE